VTRQRAPTGGKCGLVYLIAPVVNSEPPDSFAARRGSRGIQPAFPASWHAPGESQGTGSGAAGACRTAWVAECHRARIAACAAWRCRTHVSERTGGKCGLARKPFGLPECARRVIHCTPVPFCESTLRRRAGGLPDSEVRKEREGESVFSPFRGAERGRVTENGGERGRFSTVAAESPRVRRAAGDLNRPVARHVEARRGGTSAGPTRMRGGAEFSRGNNDRDR